MAHYFNPPHLVPLVEVAPAPRTAPEVVDVLCDLFTRIGKRPVRLRRGSRASSPTACRRRCFARRWPW